MVTLLFMLAPVVQATAKAKAQAAPAGTFTPRAMQGLIDGYQFLSRTTREIVLVNGETWIAAMQRIGEESPTYLPKDKAEAATLEFMLASPDYAVLWSISKLI